MKTQNKAISYRSGHTKRFPIEELVLLAKFAEIQRIPGFFHQNALDLAPDLVQIGLNMGTRRRILPDMNVLRVAVLVFRDAEHGDRLCKMMIMEMGFTQQTG